MLFDFILYFGLSFFCIMYGYYLGLRASSKKTIGPYKVEITYPWPKDGR